MTSFYIVLLIEISDNDLEKYNYIGKTGETRKCAYLRRIKRKGNGKFPFSMSKAVSTVSI